MTGEGFLSVSHMSLSRSPRLFRFFATTSSCTSSQLSTTPSPPRRKGRIPPSDPTTQSLLPPEKQRALIRLYHLCEDVITPETLEQRILDAFANPRSFAEDTSQSSLDNVLKRQRNATKMSLWNMDMEPPVAASEEGMKQSTWSSAMSRREILVVDALCGTETIKRTSPGYGTLMDSRRKKVKDELRDGVC